MAALDAKVTPLLAVTKTDLDSAQELIADYEAIGITVFALNRDLYEPAVPALALTETCPQTAPAPTVARGLVALQKQLTGEITVMLGHSGVGKKSSPRSNQR